MNFDDKRLNERNTMGKINLRLLNFNSNVNNLIIRLTIYIYNNYVFRPCCIQLKSY